MRLPLLSAIIVVFIVWLQYEIRKTSRNTRKVSERFWRREQDANMTRRLDISQLNYITLDITRLPMMEHTDSTINSYRDTILKLLDKKIVNLSGFTNTELKLKYGAANINILIECDSNYINLVSILQKWAERLYHNGDISKAITVLEYAVSFYTDVKRTYSLLAELYIQQNTPDKINHLLETIPLTQIKDKDKLIKQLKSMINE